MNAESDEGKVVKARKGYLTGYVTTIVMGSFIFGEHNIYIYIYRYIYIYIYIICDVGYSIAQYAPLQHMLEAKFSFIGESTDKSNLYYELISAFGPVGSLIGSITASPFVLLNIINYILSLDLERNGSVSGLLS